MRRQMDSVLGDLDVAAVKIGMLATAEIVAAVADGLEAWRPPLVVLDPVMVAKGVTACCATRRWPPCASASCRWRT